MGSSYVSAVGYTLGGWLPVMGCTFGFAADRARALDVVTADASLRHVDATNDTELFWALCGGKGNLGDQCPIDIGIEHPSDQQPEDLPL